MDSCRFEYARCRECEDGGLTPCLIFTADGLDDEVTLCRDHLTAALEGFDAQDFDVGSEAYEAAIAGIVRQAEMKVKRATEHAAKWAEDERSALWRQTPKAVKYYRQQKALIGVVYPDLDSLAMENLWTLDALAPL